MSLVLKMRARTATNATWDADWDREALALKTALKGNLAKKMKARTDLEDALKEARNASSAYKEIHAELDQEIAAIRAKSYNQITDADIDRICDLIKSVDITNDARVTPDLIDLREMLLENITDDIEFALPAEGTIGTGSQTWNNANSINKLFKDAINKILAIAKLEYGEDAVQARVADEFKAFFGTANPSFVAVQNTDAYNDKLNELVAFARRHKVHEKIESGVGWNEDTEEVTFTAGNQVLDKFELRLLKVFGNDPNQKSTGITTGKEILDSAVGQTVKALQQPGITGLTNKFVHGSNTGAPLSPRAHSTSRPSVANNTDASARTTVETQIERDRELLEEVFGKPIVISPVQGTNPLVVTISKMDATTNVAKELLEYQVHMVGTQWGEVRFVTGKDAHEILTDFDTKAKMLGFIATQTVKASKRVGGERRLFMEVHGVKATDITIIAFALMHSHVVPVFTKEQVEAFNQHLDVLHRKQARATSSRGTPLTEEERRTLKMAEMVSDYKNAVGGDATWKAGATSTVAATIPDDCSIQSIEHQLERVITGAYWDRYSAVYENTAISDQAKIGLYSLITDAEARKVDIIGKATAAGKLDVDSHYEKAKHTRTTRPGPSVAGGGGTRSLF